MNDDAPLPALPARRSPICLRFLELRDPRYYQIAVLLCLVTFGVLGLDFEIGAQNAVAIVCTALAIQFGATKLCRLPRFDPLSALITSLSLTLLLRTDLTSLAALAAAIAVGSKFLIRVRGKHVFNPANLAIVSLVLTSDRAWVSTGQWGSAAIGALALAVLGGLVLTRARRSGTTIAFLAAYATLSSLRAFWLGDSYDIVLHQLQNGALLIFAFFMLSDPKTTPDSGRGRVSYGALVAIVGFFIQYLFYEANALLLALVVCAPLVPVIDGWSRGSSYRWALPAVHDTGAPAGFSKGDY